MSRNDERKACLEKEAAAMAAALVGRRVTAVKFPVGQVIPHFTSVTLEFDDGSKLDVAPNSAGCIECDPDGIGWGVSADLVKAP